MFRAYAGVVQSAGAGIHRGWLAFFVLQQIAFEAVYDPWRAIAHSGGVFAGFTAGAQWFGTVELYAFVFQESPEDAHGIAAAADASGHCLGQITGHFQKLLPGLYAHHLLKVPDQHREGVRAYH